MSIVKGERTINREIKIIARAMLAVIVILRFEGIGLEWMHWWR